MSGGQQINSGQGTVQGIGGDNNYALTGSASTGAAGTTGINALIKLASRKTGSGSAQQALTGQAIASAQGAMTGSKFPTLQGQVITMLQGTVLYCGQATIAWDANTEPDMAQYWVYHGTSPLGYSEFQIVTHPTNFIVWTGLTPGQTHYFAVEAVDTSNNHSNKSVEVSKAY